MDSLPRVFEVPVADGAPARSFASAPTEIAAAVLRFAAATVAAGNRSDAADCTACSVADERVASGSAAVDWDLRTQECATYPAAVVGADI